MASKARATANAATTYLAATARRAQAAESTAKTLFCGMGKSLTRRPSRHDQAAGEDLHPLAGLVAGRRADLHEALRRARIRRPDLADLPLDAHRVAGPHPP